jgi:hypothetical protein
MSIKLANRWPIFSALDMVYDAVLGQGEAQGTQCIVLIGKIASSSAIQTQQGMEERSWSLLYVRDYRHFSVIEGFVRCMQAVMTRAVPLLAVSGKFLHAGR